MCAHDDAYRQAREHQGWPEARREIAPRHDGEAGRGRDDRPDVARACREGEGYQRRPPPEEGVDDRERKRHVGAPEIRMRQPTHRVAEKLSNEGSLAL